MPKTNLNRAVMSQIKSGELKMKPKWYFAVGSLLMFTGLVVIFTGVIFLTNIIIFSVRKQGLVNPWQLEHLLSCFPLWIPFVAIIGVIVGIYLLRKYDFSYRKNFPLIIAMITLAIVIASWSIDQLGLNQALSTRTPMRKFYEQLDKPSSRVQPESPGRGTGSVQGVHKRGIVN